MKITPKGPYSPKLRAAMHEIADVLKKHDVGGVMILGDGEGHSEYRLFIDTPSWSTLRFIKDGSGVHFQAYAKSKPVETSRTVNLIWGLLDVVGSKFMVLDKIKTMANQHLNVESDKGDFFHGPYDDGGGGK